MLSYPCQQQLSYWTDAVPIDMLSYPCQQQLSYCTAETFNTIQEDNLSDASTENNVRPSKAAIEAMRRVNAKPSKAAVDAMKRVSAPEFLFYSEDFPRLTHNIGSHLGGIVVV